MLILLVVLTVFAGVGYMATTPQDHERVRQAIKAMLRPVVAEIQAAHLATEPFRAALRTRTPWALAAPIIIGLHVAVFARMLLTGAAGGDADSLIAWGASVGPRTTGGEWWRLATAPFVHAGALHLAADLAGLVMLGRMLERFVGSATLVSVYIAAGAVAGLVSVAEQPLTVHVGASASIVGLYGLLFAATGWGVVRRHEFRVPLAVFRALAPTAVPFLIYTAATRGLTSPPILAGLGVGLAAGLALTRDIGERKPEARPLALTMAVAMACLIGLAIPVRGVIDVRPEIASVLTVEERTLGPYKAAVQKFTQGKVEAGVLAAIINDDVLPEVQQAHARVEKIGGVLDEQRPLLADAKEYLRLREESWRLRAEGLRRGSMTILREADAAERLSLQALERLRNRRFTVDVQT